MTDCVDLVREIASQKLLSGYKERLVFYLGDPTHPAIIQSCYWIIMQPKGGFSPLPSYIYQFIIKCLNFCLDN